MKLEPQKKPSHLFEPYLKCKDHSVSGEQFELLYDKEYDMLHTSPAPQISDLGKYYESEDYISHTDSKKSFLDTIYQIVKKYTIQKKVVLLKSLIEDRKKGLNILDIGCGTGDFLLACKKNKFNVTGIEPNKGARSLSETKLNSEIVEDISKLGKAQFDCITMWHVLEHVPNLSEYIKSLKKLLKTDGVLIVAVPNFKSYDANYYQKFWAAYDVPRHLSHFSQTAIGKLFSREKIELVKTIPMKFDAYYVSILSEKNIRGKSNFIKGMYLGLKSNLKAIRTKEYSSLIYILKKVNY